MSAPFSDSREREKKRQQLLAAARAGDREALWQLLLSYRPYLFKVVSRALPTDLAGEAASVMQSGLAAAVDAFRQFRGDQPPQLAKWLAMVVRSKVQRRLRAKHLQPLPEDPDHEDVLAAEDTSLSEREWRREQAARLLEEVARLPPDRQEVLHLRIFNELSWADIATQLNESEVVLRQRYSRALKNLRARLRGSDEPRP